MAMLACVEILFAASLLMVSSRLSLTESAILSAHVQEKQIALQAAQLALVDARDVVRKGLLDASSNKNISYGSLTGNRLELHGHLQSNLLPLYRIKIIEIAKPKNNVVIEEGSVELNKEMIYRVTALGYGAQSTTQVMLESDFSKMNCVQQSDCVNFFLRRLNWRQLHQLPSDW
jgi:Tfp pilus assembly protein PilX